MKPSEINSIKAKKTIFLLPSFSAIMWCGKIYCRSTNRIEKINSTDEIDSTLKCHEMIHIRQAQAMNDSWIRFYWNYIISYIKNIPLITINSKAPYLLLPVEIEAYINENNFKYVEKNQPVYGWKKYQKLTLKDKREIARELFKENTRKKLSTLVNKHLKDKKL